MEKPDSHIAPIKDNSCKGLIKKGIPVGLKVDDVESLISPFKLKEDGNFTMFDNDAFDELQLFKIRPEARKVYDYLYRKIIGYQKIVDRIALSQIEDGTGLSMRSVGRALEELLQRNMIVKIKNRSNCYYGLTHVYKWTPGVILKIVEKKPIQPDLLTKYYTKSTDDRTGLNQDRTGLNQDRTGLNQDRTGLKKDTSAEHKRNININIKKSLNARVREGHELCKITTTNGLTKEEINQHIAIHNCNDSGSTCPPDDGPDDCWIFGKLQIAKINRMLDNIGNGNDAGQSKKRI